MKRKIKSNLKYNLIILTVILLIFLAVIFIPTKEVAKTDEEIAKCIGEKSTLYVQLGCSHCKTQEEILGENIKYITTIDCFYERDKCEKITATPTWKIGNDYIIGVKTLDELREIAGC